MPPFGCTQDRLWTKSYAPAPGWSTRIRCGPLHPERDFGRVVPANGELSVTLVFEGNDGAAVAAEGGDSLEVAVGPGQGHYGTIAVNGVAGGGEVPASAFGVFGDLGGGLP